MEGAHRNLFATMIQSRRAAWAQGDFPFYFVQLAPYDGAEPDIWAELRESQTTTLALPNTGMVVQTDIIPDARDIHPLSKQEVARRLALWALARTYRGENYL